MNIMLPVTMMVLAAAAKPKYDPADPTAWNVGERKDDAAWAKQVQDGMPKEERIAALKATVAGMTRNLTVEQPRLLKIVEANRQRDPGGVQRRRDVITHMTARLKVKQRELDWLEGRLTLDGAREAVAAAEKALAAAEELKAAEDALAPLRTALAAARAELAAVLALEGQPAESPEF